MIKPALCVTPTSMPGVVAIRPWRFHDRRGFFLESYNKRALSDAGITIDFVQDNLSLSEPVHTLRGLHFQKEPFGQAKLVSVVAGAVLDVVVDLRKGSSHFGKHMSVKLSAESGDQLFIPVGFAHAFLTLRPNTLFSYKVSAYYSLEHDSGIRFDDPTLAIDWGVPADAVTVSEKDRDLPLFEMDSVYFA